MLNESRVWAAVYCRVLFGTVRGVGSGTPRAGAPPARAPCAPTAAAGLRAPPARDGGIGNAHAGNDDGDDGETAGGASGCCAGVEVVAANITARKMAVADNR